MEPSGSRAFQWTMGGNEACRSVNSIAYASSLLFAVDPYAKAIFVGVVDEEEKCEGNKDNEDSPKAALPDMSPATRREACTDPVEGHTKVNEPLPPPAVSAAAGFVVEMHKV